MSEWNEDLDGMESFVLEGKKFVRLPEDETWLVIIVSDMFSNSMKTLHKIHNSSTTLSCIQC